MWELDCEESWALKYWCFWAVVLEKTLKSPLDCKEIQPIHSEGDQPWDFFGRNDAKAETPVLWPPHAKSWLIGKDPNTGRDWGQEEKGMTEDEMAGWHHRLDAHEFEWTPGVGGGQGGLACCDSWCHKESDTTEWVNWTQPTEQRLNLACLKCAQNTSMSWRRAGQSPPQRLFYNKVLSISCNVLNISLRMKDRTVVWVQEGCRCIGCLPWWSSDWWATVQSLHAHVSKFKSWSTVSNECSWFSHHHNVSKS